MQPVLSPEELEFLDQIAAESIVPVEPPAAVKAKVMTAIHTVPGPHQSQTVRANEGTWKTIAPGVRTKKLARDDRRMTFLIELEPHAVLPEHEHEGGEDSYVIRGSCHIGGLSLSQGDFHHADAQSRHGDVVASGEGCLLLIAMAAAA